MLNNRISSLIFQNVRHLTALSIADMNGIPMDFLQSFDQLKVLNLSGNHMVNTSLKLLDDINGLEVSFKKRSKEREIFFPIFLHIFRVQM